MKSSILRTALATLVVAGAAFGAHAATDSRSVSFNDGWRFLLADSAGFSNAAYSDAHWRSLSLPHDWAIEGDFSQDNPSGTGGGALPGGVGWYRKTFRTPAGNDRVYVDFDGVYMNSTVYINGHELGTRPYGYASFSYDLTPWLKPAGEENVIAVRVDNAEQPNSRWYSGCGIYRNVWLRTLPDVHVGWWGHHVTPRRLGETDKWEVDVNTTIENTSDKAASLELRSSLMDGDRVVASDSRRLTVEPGKKADGMTELPVTAPRLWDTENPELYTVKTVVVDLAKGQPIDSISTTTGFRWFKFDSEKGFSLNGKPTKIRGVCMHHDLGALGAAVNTRGIERQLEILKEMGVNGYRCSHNPPAPEVLDLADKMGFIVMDESFDMWRRAKTSHDYSRYFPDWAERDLTDLIVRDRNHPSVIIWSIGNEVLEQWSSASADTLTLEQANLILNFGHGAEQLASADSEMSFNSLLTKRLADMVREHDSTRPVTAGCNEPRPGNHLFRSGALDIIGYNYHDEWFDSVPHLFPGMPFIITESVSSLQTRGYYRMPSDSAYIAPVRWDIPFYDPSFSCSAYDNSRAPWGNHHEGTLRHFDEKDFISGQFIWTGFDYIGEPTPYGWPARSSYFGIVDLAGIPKDVYYMYQSQWRPDKTVLHLFPHWNWTPGEIVDLWAYYNNADEVELFVNGVSQGAKSLEPGKYHVAWRVEYQPGEIKAVSRKDGKTVAEKTIRTAGAPAAIRLTPDRTEIAADGSDLSYVLVEILDADGNLCPQADNDVTFAVEGAGFNAGVDNGSPISLERFKDNHRKAFNGKAMLIVRNDGTAGTVKVTATSPKLSTAKTEITAK